LTTSREPIRLEPLFLGKIWGDTELEPWFPATGTKIGEVWFRAPGEPLPILVKFVFTSERLSVQVHPGDEYARANENSPGKTEMWHVLRSKPGASVALGLRKAIDRDGLREAARSGEIEHMLDWLPVQPGDTIFVPAGTIHAIGPGLVLCEIQQQSDVTYRLYDYGRPRELHLDKAIDVAITSSYVAQSEPAPAADGARRLAACPYFVTDAIELPVARSYEPYEGRMNLLIMIEGSGRIARQPFAAGEVWLVPAQCEPFRLEPAVPCRLLRTYVP
jgi:mannose-6-phosphate isomerase